MNILLGGAIVIGFDLIINGQSDKCRYLIGRDMQKLA